VEVVEEEGPSEPLTPDRCQFPAWPIRTDSNSAHTPCPRHTAHVRLLPRPTLRTNICIFRGCTAGRRGGMMTPMAESACSHVDRNKFMVESLSPHPRFGPHLGGNGVAGWEDFTPFQNWGRGWEDFRARVRYTVGQDREPVRCGPGAGPIEKVSLFPGGKRCGRR